MCYRGNQKHDLFSRDLGWVHVLRKVVGKAGLRR